MVDELTRESFATGKAVVEIAVDLLKLLATEIDKKAREAKYSSLNAKSDKEVQAEKAEMSLGGWANEEDLDSMNVPNKDVADAFEEKLKEHGFKYERLSDEKFIVAAKNRNMINDVIQETAKEIAKEKAEQRANPEKAKQKQEQKAKKKESFKEKVDRYKQKAGQKDKNRQREKQKQKSKNQNKSR